jgi:hypothetical protein
MKQNVRDIKKRYFMKVYQAAPMIPCACGCGARTKAKDQYGRDKMFINGHNGRKYGEAGQYQKEWRKRNRRTLYENKIKRGHDLKRRAVMLRGGKCLDCSLIYDGKNGAIFQFHHRSPREKLFPVNARTLVTHAWEKIEAELKKCDLLCANCHFKRENEEY